MAVLVSPGTAQNTLSLYYSTSQAIVLGRLSLCLIHIHAAFTIWLDALLKHEEIQTDIEGGVHGVQGSGIIGFLI